MGIGSAPAILTDRDGVPTTDSLRAWASHKVQALAEACSSSFDSQVAKALQVRHGSH